MKIWWHKRIGQYKNDDIYILAAAGGQKDAALHFFRLNLGNTSLRVANNQKILRKIQPARETGIVARHMLLHLNIPVASHWESDFRGSVCLAKSKITFSEMQRSTSVLGDHFK